MSVNRSQAGLISEPVVTDAIDGQLMLANIEDLGHVPLVLLSVLQALEKAVAKRSFYPNPRLVGRITRAPAGHQVQITIIPRQAQQRIEPIAQPENRSEEHTSE